MARTRRRGRLRWARRLATVGLLGAVVTVILWHVGAAVPAPARDAAMRTAMHTVETVVRAAAARRGADTPPSTGAAGHPPAGRPSADAAPAAAPAVPVSIAPARRADVPVYLEGLGTVKAYNTATVKTRVDGEIQTVRFVEGQAVRPGDVLVQIDPRPMQAQYDQAVAKKAQDEAQLANAKLDLHRYQKLLRTNAASKQQADTQAATVAGLEATVRADQGAIDAAKVQLDYATITAPFDGVTGIRKVDPGNIVHATDTGGIVVLTQLQPIAVIFTLPEKDLAPIAGAMRAGKVMVTARSPDGNTELGRGTVLLIDNEIDETTGTIKLKAVFQNRRRLLWPGQFVNARLLLHTDHNVLTVPSAAVEHGPDGLFAYAVKADDTVERRALEVGEQSGAVTVVTSGLRDGDRVVTAGQYALDQGTAVKPTGSEEGRKDDGPKHHQPKDRSKDHPKTAANNDRNAAP